MFIISTRGGLVSANGAPTFRLASRGDSTMVTVEGNAAPRPYTVTPQGSLDPESITRASVLLRADPSLPPQIMVMVQPGDTGRIVRGSAPTMNRGNSSATRPLVRFRR